MLVIVYDRRYSRSGSYVPSRSAVVDFDDEFDIASMNPAARRVFGYAESAQSQLDERALLSKPSQVKLAACASELSTPGAGTSL
ncbi:MAG: hypothetical protein QM756_38545 [Polyangiaceae bacterium]